VRRAGRIVAEALAAATEACRPGRAAAEVSDAVAEVLRARGAESLFRGYRQRNAPPFPAEACVSVNEQVVHAIPGWRALQPGDLVTIDVGARKDGWCADAATTILIPGGPRDDDLYALVSATRSILQHAVERMTPGVRWSDLALELERRTDETGFGLVTEFVGHAIGRELHETPKAPAYASGYVGPDFVLEPGVVLAVEPILTLGRGPATVPSASPEPGSRGPSGKGLPAWRMPVRTLEDGWTVVTVDGAPACHEEHVVAVRPGAGDVLTA